MIEILIPTFNRSIDIKKNLELLIDEINKNNLHEKVSILISNNYSTDNTKSIIEEIANNTDINISIYNQKDNIGLEKNAVFLLEKSTDQFIMYLGDDDYLPDGYLRYVVNKINDVENLTCIIPGMSDLYKDGMVRLSRIEEFDEKFYDPSFETVKRISRYGHQMSGLLLKREGLYKNYTADEKLRNIYLFLYFVAYNNLKGTSIYAPKYKVLVSADNSKDWCYDDSGLLTEIFKNFKILYPRSYIKRNIMNFVFLNQNIWRLSGGKSLRYRYVSLIHLEKDKNIDSLTKIALPFYYIYLFMRMVLLRIKGFIFK